MYSLTQANSMHLVSRHIILGNSTVCGIHLFANNPIHACTYLMATQMISHTHSSAQIAVKTANVCRAIMAVVYDTVRSIRMGGVSASQ